MNAKNSQAGISANTAAAIMSPQETANFDTKLSSPTGKVITSFLLINISENNSSLHAAVNTKPSVAAIPGNVSGVITLRSAIKRVHPSSIADSSKSFGTLSKNDCIRNVANGTLKAV